MKKMIYQKFLSQTLKHGAKIAIEMFGKTSSKIKDSDPNQILTEADLAIGKFIVNEVKKNYPSYNIIDEEAGVVDKKSLYTWVIDPIDGTANFAVGVPTYGIMIGLLKDHHPFAGGVVLPYFNMIYIAEKEKGTFLNGKKSVVDIERSLNESLVAYKGPDKNPSDPEITRKEGVYISSIAARCLLVRNSGSVFDTAMLAKSGYSGVLSQNCKIWDNVAQHVIVEEAGGIYTDFFGKTMDYSTGLTMPDLNYTYCAASPKVHKQLQEIIHSIK